MTTNSDDRDYAAHEYEVPPELPSFEDSAKYLNELSDGALGSLFKVYLDGYSDTDMEGFSEEAQVAIRQFLGDMVIAHRTLANDQ